MGITNMCGNIPGILSPIAVGKLTPNVSTLKLKIKYR